jgi:hypothetical protein
MNQITLLFTFFSLLLVNGICAQTRILKGQIINENFEPISNAIIRLNISGKTIESDDFGMFEINIDNRENDIEAVCIGYKTEKVDIEKKCYVNIVMINYNNREFENVNAEKTYYEKSRRHVRNSYKKAIKSGLLKKEEPCYH